ncbi:hypothetical protein BN159_0118 [Streptomyces davaonensis JCM 4913]|uniref:Transposase Helix-turn-helix domain-containing protein n=1 Tax=Streptomyces davaonensis (strain DSM 101723 / JCM 4913 / KCC S-0913 / 768) TaxID=1214101 RepID=K4QUG2_STRDJ|nr:hypothetical protein BN159_0118 [Streptomyces davaonensis JCM 4913]
MLVRGGDVAKPLVVGVVISLNTPTAGGASLVPYPSTPDVPHELVEHVSWLIYARRCEQGTRWRKLSCFRQALLALAQLGAGFGISEATAWRYVDETVDVLAAWAPGLREALTGRGEDDFVILDGTLIPTDRVAADEPYCSVGTERGDGVATGPFLRAARRTRRAALTAPGSPRSLPFKRA